MAFVCEKSKNADQRADLLEKFKTLLNEIEEKPMKCYPVCCPQKPSSAKMCPAKVSSSIMYVPCKKVRESSSRCGPCKSSSIMSVPCKTSQKGPQQVSSSKMCVPCKTVQECPQKVSSPKMYIPCKKLVQEPSPVMCVPCVKEVKESSSRICKPCKRPFPESSSSRMCVPCKEGQHKKKPETMLCCIKNVKKNGKIEDCKSRELLSSILIMGCDCEKRNGLQDDCQRSECRGSPECLTKPDPTCQPSCSANGKHLYKKQELRNQQKNGGKDQMQCYPCEMYPLSNLVCCPTGPSYSCC